MQTAPNTLLTVRESATALRNQVESFISDLDAAISESPKDLEAVLDRVKNEVLASLATNNATNPNRDRATYTAGSECPQCGKVLKNDVGLAIHVGREHGKKARKARRGSASTPESLAVTE